MTERELAVRHHWRANRILTVILLSIWATLILGVALFARDLNEHTLLGVPLAFYIFAQGGPIAFLLIVVVHARVMNRLDRSVAAAQHVRDA